MKKMILLLVLPLTALMAIDFTMTKEGLFVESSSTIQPPTSGMAPEATNNPYLEPVNLPACDAGNPEVQFIRSTADWSKINSSSKRIFCVSPGDYRSLGNINLTASGTAKNRRYIILNNGNNTHPGKLDKNQLAMFALNFKTASYWTVDRGAWNGSSVGIVYYFTGGSSYNIINRAYVTNNFCTVEIKESCHNNTIQTCRIDGMTEAARNGDQVSIRLISYTTTFDIKNTKLINNEIKNSGDAFQSVLAGVTDPNKQNGNGEGTIVDGNDFYINSDIYTDGNGKYNPNGAYAIAENAIDLKFGSKNASNPMVFTNNRMWGYRKTDTTNHVSGDPGYAVVAHYDVGNVVFNDNIIFDSNSGFGASDKKDYPHAFHSAEMKRNIFYDCGQVYGSATTTYPVLIGSSDAITFSNNVIMNGRNHAMFFGFNSSKMMVTNNDIINSEGGVLLQSNNGGTYTPNNIYSTAAEADYAKDYVFIADKYTNSPMQIILKDVVKSE